MTGVMFLLLGLTFLTSHRLLFRKVRPRIFSYLLALAVTVFVTFGVMYVLERVLIDNSPSGRTINIMPDGEWEGMRR